MAAVPVSDRVPKEAVIVCPVRVTVTSGEEPPPTGTTLCGGRGLKNLVGEILGSQGGVIRRAILV
jgi:hypothetical protein